MSKDLSFLEREQERLGFKRSDPVPAPPPIAKKKPAVRREPTRQIPWQETQAPRLRRGELAEVKADVEHAGDAAYLICMWFLFTDGLPKMDAP
jgi:hypothetical protein